MQNMKQVRKIARSRTNRPMKKAGLDRGMEEDSKGCMESFQG